MQKKKILVFGTFDGIHGGHIHFLKEAKKLGELFVSVASDKSIMLRKKRLPERKQLSRVSDLKKQNVAKVVSVGDNTLNSWSVIKKINPDVIALGYDQDELKKALLKEKKYTAGKFEIKTMSAFKPRELHSSIINKKCAFCTIPEIKARTIIENKYAWAFPTNIPIVPGHVLISPKRCVATFEDMTKEEQSAVFSLQSKLKTALKKTFTAEGFNIAWNEGEFAGQSVPHFHLHLLPRKPGDTGITKYEPRKFIYRPGSREATPEKELQEIVKIIRKNLNI